MTIPSASVVVAIVSGATMVRDRDLVAVALVGLVESVTVTTTVLAPAADGVPLITPVKESILSPAGIPVADQVYGTVPPVAATVALYAVPAVPFGRGEAVVMVSDADMVTGNVFVKV